MNAKPDDAPNTGIICIIPARAGSKGIPGKNLAKLGGKPLLAWSVEAALASGAVNRVLVSTDCEAIAREARVAGAQVPFLRPPALAGDHVHAVHVALHALDWLRAHERARPEGVMMLLPTSPLRRAEDIRAAVALFRRRHAPAVVSVTDLGKYRTNLRTLRGERLDMVFSGEDRNGQRQGMEKLYGVNGSIFLARPDALREAGTFHVEGALAHVMAPLNSIDINEPGDLEAARLLCALVHGPGGERSTGDAIA